jgi:pterin-4a-carbinolamine dehydratase
MPLKLSHIFDNPEPRDYRDGADFGEIKPLPGLDWKTLDNPNRLSKVFKFPNSESLVGFVGAVLQYEGETFHQGRITIQQPVVKIETWTKNLGEITEMDIEYAKEVNEIYEDWKNAR